MLYRAIRVKLQSKPKLIPIDHKFESESVSQLDCYTSLFYYNDTQKAHFENTGTLSGLTDTVTDKLFFDFDSKDDITLAKKDAIDLLLKLKNLDVSEDAIEVYFSGNKGFAVEVHLNSYITNKQFKSAVFNLASEYKTFDTVVNDPNRIIRMPNSKHQVSGLYKVQLDLPELESMSIDNIQKLAQSPRAINFVTQKIALPPQLLEAKEEKKEVKVVADLSDIDFSKKSKGWSNCKWALKEGYSIVKGDRHSKLLCLVATAKALNYSKEDAYSFAKNADIKGVDRNGGSRIDKNELWDNIVSDVYSEKWKGGAFTCKDGKTPWLTSVCNSLGHNKCKHEDEKVFVEMEDLSDIFTKFATDIEKNKITTGVPELDKNVTLCTSTLVGLLGNPGSGKTSLSLNILNNCSVNNINSIFFSMDMGVPLVYLKLVQKHFGIPHDKAFEIFKNEKEKAALMVDEIKKLYANVRFSFKSGLDVDDIRANIISHQETTGQKVKLVVIDYLECISGPYSDSTANTSVIANKLKDLANETETCVLLLLQTQKHSSAPDEPLLSMKNIKGSSVIEQACSVILSIWREGYTPNHSNMDKFISIATVKDRFNGLWKYDFHWEGLTGKIRELEDFEQDDLEKLRDLKKREKDTSQRDY